MSVILELRQEIARDRWNHEEALSQAYHESRQALSQLEAVRAEAARGSPPPAGASRYPQQDIDTLFHDCETAQTNYKEESWMYDKLKQEFLAAEHRLGSFDDEVRKLKVSNVQYSSRSTEARMENVALRTELKTSVRDTENARSEIDAVRLRLTESMEEAESSRARNARSLERMRNQEPEMSISFRDPERNKEMLLHGIRGRTESLERSREELTETEEVVVALTKGLRACQFENRELIASSDELNEMKESLRRHKSRQVDTPNRPEASRDLSGPAETPRTAKDSERSKRLEQSMEKQIAAMMEQMSVQTEASARLQQEIFSQQTMKFKEQAESERNKFSEAVAKASVNPLSESLRGADAPRPQVEKLVLGPRDESLRQPLSAAAASSSYGVGPAPQSDNPGSSVSGGPQRPSSPKINLLTGEVAVEVNPWQKLPEVPSLKAEPAHKSIAPQENVFMHYTIDQAGSARCCTEQVTLWPPG